MYGLWIFFLRKRAFTYLLMGALTVGGIFSALIIPKESAPEVIIPIGIVSTTLRGASAEDTEKLITNKIEDEVANIEDIDKVTSSSREGLSIVTAQFTASANIDKAMQDLKEAVDRAKVEFPKEADQPTVSRVNFADQPILILSVSQDVAPSQLTKLGEDLKNEIKKVKGISQVNISGTRKREVNVVIKQEALEKYGLRLDQVVSAIGSANATFPIGTITVSNIDYPIKFQGGIDEPNQVPDISIASLNGIPVYLRDIAFVADGLEPPTTFSRASVGGDPGTQALTLYIFKKTGGDVTKITEAVKTRISELQSSLLLGSHVVISFDRGELVNKDLRDLTRVGLETVALVMLMLFLTIGWRESIVAALSIPLSFVIAFIGLYASGNSINFVSLFSLILAIGILVDSGIVVTEAIHTRLKAHPTPEEAAVASIHEYAWPLIAGTMTTVAVFLPLFFISGITGKFIASIPFTVIFVLIASIIVALGMVPLLAVVLTRGNKNRFEELQEVYAEKVTNWYKNLLGRILDHRSFQNKFLTVMVIGFIAAILLPVTGVVKVTFFPQGDQDFIYIQLEKPEGTPLAETDMAVRSVEEILYENTFIDSFVTTVGESSTFSNNGSSKNTKLANITVNLKKERDKTSSEIVTMLRKSLSPIHSMIIHVEESNNGPPTGAPIVIKFLGNNLDELGIAADKAEHILANIKGAVDVQTSLRDDGTQFTLTIDRTKAAQFGISASEIAQILRTAVSGITATTIKNQEKDIDVVVKLNLNPHFVNAEDTIKTTIDSIKQIPITGAEGFVLMGSLITAKASESRAIISHDSRKRIATVSSGLTPDMTAVEVTKAFQKREAELELPASVAIDYGGENEEVDKSFRDMFFALLAGMALMLAILVLEFNSFRFTFYLLGIVPLSLIGVLSGLALAGKPLSFPSMLGFIALSGVIINHAIILLDSMMRLLHRKEDKTLREVIIEASAVRLRPIFLTTITTVIGMVPLAGASPLWGPLAFAIMFGLTFAMILTLILIPVLFYRFPGKEFANKRHETSEQVPNS